MKVRLPEKATLERMKLEESHAVKESVAVTSIVQQLRGSAKPVYPGFTIARSDMSKDELFEIALRFECDPAYGKEVALRYYKLAAEAGHKQAAYEIERLKRIGIS